MAKPGTVTGWKLPRDEREQLLARFAPQYENVVADHVTLRTGATKETRYLLRHQKRAGSSSIGIGLSMGCQPRSRSTSLDSRALRPGPSDQVM